MSRTKRTVTVVADRAVASMGQGGQLLPPILALHPTPKIGSAQMAFSLSMEQLNHKNLIKIKNLFKMTKFFKYFPNLSKISHDLLEFPTSKLNF